MVTKKAVGDETSEVKEFYADVLKEYQLELKILEHQENYCLVEGISKRFALWDYRLGGEDADDLLQCLEFLNTNGCKSLPRLFKTEKNSRTIKKAEKTMFLSSFPIGEICDTTKNVVVQTLSGTLSEIHEKSALFKGLSSHNNECENLGKLQGMLYELLMYKALLENKRFHSDFELIFLEYFDLLYSQGQECLEIMNMAGFGCPEIERVFLLNSFLPQYVVSLDNHYMFLDLHRIGFGPRVKDLALFLKTFMPLYAWDEKILKDAINVYQKSKKLSFTEKHSLIAQLRFPGRYWLYAYWYLNENKNSQELTELLKNYILDWNMRDKGLDSVQTWLLGE